MATTTTDNRTYATGKRKTAIARVWVSRLARAKSPSTTRPADQITSSVRRLAWS